MSTHIIHRQLFDVEVAGTESGGIAVQNSLLAICRRQLSPALENMLDRLIPANEHWTLDRLDIDLGSLKPEDLERSLVESVTQAIERRLRERAPRVDSTGLSGLEPMVCQLEDRRIRSRTDAQTLQHAFLYFLETGVLPWWLSLPDDKTLEDLIRETWRASQPDGVPERFAHVLTRAIGSAVVRKRLVRQFSAGFLETLMAGASPEAAAAMQEILRVLGQHMEAPALKSFLRQVWETAFAMALSGDRPTAESVIASSLKAMPLGEPQLDAPLLERIAQQWPAAKSHGGGAASGTRIAAPKRWSERYDPAPTVDFAEGVFINCAGVVLLHPFLPSFFEALGIAKNGRLIQPERALCLLHYLATGRRFAPEYDLLLPKILCDVPVDTPVESVIELTAADEEEASALLTAVIRHWDALGNTSIDGLRGTFLVRPGKLSRRGLDDVLQVEERSFDILLDRLPWGIGMIQLPWMEKLLWVEWRF